MSITQALIAILLICFIKCITWTIIICVFVVFICFKVYKHQSRRTIDVCGQAVLITGCDTGMAVSYTNFRCLSYYIHFCTVIFVYLTFRLSSSIFQMLLSQVAVSVQFKLGQGQIICSGSVH